MKASMKNYKYSPPLSVDRSMPRCGSIGVACNAMQAVCAAPSGVVPAESREQSWRRPLRFDPLAPPRPFGPSLVAKIFSKTLR